ncbi:GntR domain protein (fragment) [Paraburkholderia piptadeniae]|uniref:GntR domain protein n=1 Tax=Paraburkholderia piptadeniae TaxID=1701573 RepID=A0A1N7SPH6_9BURK
MYGLRHGSTDSLRAHDADQTAHAAHKKIYDAVAARDPDRAERAMLEHLGHVEAFYWQEATGDDPAQPL